MIQPDQEPSWRERVWLCVAGIPEGKVATYGQIAELAGLPGYARQVGQALRELPNGSTLPWHRVINSQGKISFAEGSAAFNRQVGKLQQENVAVLGGRIKLSEFRWQP